MCVCVCVSVSGVYVCTCLCGVCMCVCGRGLSPTNHCLISKTFHRDRNSAAHQLTRTQLSLRIASKRKHAADLYEHTRVGGA